MCGRMMIFVTAVIILISVRQEAYGEPLYYISRDEYENEIFAYDVLEFYGNFTDVEKAYALFELLFSGNYNFAPKGIKIIEIHMRGGTLVLNVSDGITAYGGGSAYEKRLAAQIIKTALGLSSVEKVTLLIEGFLEYLPEGSLIYEENAIPEIWSLEPA